MLNVPGATLYYELDGTGPVLLMIQVPRTSSLMTLARSISGNTRS